MASLGLTGKGFVGAGAVAARRRSGPAQRMVSIVLDDEAACPLGDEPVYVDGRLVGQVTSAAFGYRVQRPVALAYVDAALMSSGPVSVALDIAGATSSGRAFEGPAFDPSGTRMRGA